MKENSISETKMYALEQIKGLCSGIIYARAGDEVIVIRDECGMMLCRNVVSGELFSCRSERVGVLADVRESSEPEEVRKVGKAGRRIEIGDANQGTLF